MAIPLEQEPSCPTTISTHLFTHIPCPNPSTSTSYLIYVPTCSATDILLYIPPYILPYTYTVHTSSNHSPIIFFAFIATFSTQKHILIVYWRQSIKPKIHYMALGPFPWHFTSPTRGLLHIFSSITAHPEYWLIDSISNYRRTKVPSLDVDLDPFIEENR